MTATTSFIAALQCTKFVSARAAPRTPLGECTDHLASAKETYL